jgi:drug/metabolite transporter (DMT)-like permease
MHYLLFALFFSTCIFIVFKFFNRFNVSILPAVATNYLLASALGYFSRWETTTIPFLLQQPWLVLAVFTGISFILTFVVFAISTQKAGVAMTVVSGKLSIILSVAAGLIILSEPFSWLKISGITTAILAFYLTNKGRGEANVTIKYLYLPVLIFLSTGANDILMKLSGVYYAGRDEIQFLTVTFFTAFVIGFALVIYNMQRNALKIQWKDIAAGLLLGILNWYSTYFFIKGLYILPISVFVPVFNASLVFIAALTGFFFFNEKLSVLNRIGIALAVLAIGVIAFS